MPYIPIIRTTDDTGLCRHHHKPFIKGWYEGGKSNKTLYKERKVEVECLLKEFRL